METDGRGRSQLRRMAGPLLVVTAVALANFPALARLVDVNPLASLGGIGTSQKGFLPGLWSADPNIAWTAQPLGHLAALDWLHGIVPWWNPFEGLGAPLAAEMQSAALFPPTLLLALPQGQLFFHLSLEAAAGLATWFLARELGFGRGVATLAGIMFALNGTLAWFGSANANPVAFLPLALLGVERLWRRAGPDPLGLLILACSLALSVYAGFPETAYLDGLFVAVWAIYRLAGHPAAGRRRFAARIAMGAALGVMLAAPLLVAFLGYLPIADIGRHTGALANVHLPARSAPLVGLPYLYGPLDAFFSNPYPRGLNLGGGFVTAPALALAFIGLVAGRLERSLRVLLAAAVVLLILWQFGVPPVSTVLERVVPFADRVVASRFTEPAVELALVLLACLGVEAVATRRAARAVVIAGGLFALAVVAVDVAIAWPTMMTISHHSAAYRTYPFVMVAWAVALVAGVTAAGVLAGRRAVGAVGAVGAAVVMAIVALDALAMFIVPQLSAPRSVSVDLGPAEYLAAHLGEGRFFSLWIFRPDYGSYFGLASADVDDLPVPKLWATYVEERLSTNASPLVFDGHSVLDAHGPTATEELVERLPAYEAMGVRFVLTTTGTGPWTGPFGAAQRLRDGVHAVYSDDRVTIYALPDPQPYFSIAGGSCRLDGTGSTTVVTRCLGPATLVRSELDLPGWSATVNGRPAKLQSIDGGVMSVRVGQGASVVSFAYLPPHEDLGIALFVLGVLSAVGAVLVWGTRRGSRPRQV